MRREDNIINTQEIEDIHIGRYNMVQEGARYGKRTGGDIKYDKNLFFLDLLSQPSKQDLIIYTENNNIHERKVNTSYLDDHFFSDNFFFATENLPSNFNSDVFRFITPTRRSANFTRLILLMLEIYSIIATLHTFCRGWRIMNKIHGNKRGKGVFPPQLPILTKMELYRGVGTMPLNIYHTPSAMDGMCWNN